MAHMLNTVSWTFLGVKLAVGGFAAYVLYRCAHLPLARHGLTCRARHLRDTNARPRRDRLRGARLARAL